MNAVTENKPDLLSETGADADAPNATTQRAKEESIISPRFYTTDFDAMDRIDVSHIQAQWDALMAEFKQDNNRKHFKRTDEFADAVAKMPPELHDEFLDFLVTSCTSEYSGCVLYADIKQAVNNKEVQDVMGYMARDESRHAGFINQSLKDFGLDLDLKFLREEKKYTFFKPKFIYYATYLSEKIGYARYITIHRELERHPERRFHPIFKWFEEWCNDEFRHGEVFALLMRAKPHLLRGRNLYWIRFFLLAVYATMFVRDHTRPAIHGALGLEPEDFGFKVFRITNEIAKQVFPVELDIDNPKFRAGLRKLVRISEAKAAAKERGGVLGWVKNNLLAAQGFLTFAGLYLLPVNKQALPDNPRVEPVW